MVEVSLSAEEVEITLFVIERYRKALLFEIAKTDSHELKQYLRQREELLEALVQKLESYSGPPEAMEG